MSSKEKEAVSHAFCKLSGQNGCEIDPEGAVALLEKVKRKRKGEACWMLGLCCEYGIGIEQDTLRAISLYERSCDMGNSVGKILLFNYKVKRGSGVMKVECL